MNFCLNCLSLIIFSKYSRVIIKNSPQTLQQFYSTHKTYSFLSTMKVLFLISVALATVVARSEESGELKKVSCGGHDAKVCYRCPLDPDTGKWNGESGCNGDCKWNDNRGCEPKIKVVSCGNHAAKVCYKCPVDPDTGKWNGESGCNGDCKWNGYKGCEPKTAAEIEEDISQFLRGNKEEKYY
uniref:Uncharacterized protein n=1 Tax=Eucampia antarctica TaxID=49252 RepID=A0A7S2WD02_9STRA|mmetsp:Transcript_26593/g.25458  ORF Transcript_26593/g.25458 Transcript_26593/m.25458 type:complete len:183 (+) Transcript_26593:57-605(+)